MITKKIGIIGCGNMSGAILYGIRKRWPEQRKCLCIRHQAGMRGAVIERINVSTEKSRSL